MENWEIVRANALELASGDMATALDLTARECARLKLQTSAGYLRDKPSHSPLALHKTRAAPVLIAGEAPHG